MPKIGTSETRQLKLRVPPKIGDRLEKAAYNRGETMSGLATYLFNNLNPDFGAVPISRRPVKKWKRAFEKYHQKIILWEKLGGLTIYQIADLWGCNKSTVARIVNRESSYSEPLSVDPLPLSCAQCEELRTRKKEDDCSYRILAKDYGVSKTTAFNIYKKVGVYRYYGQPKQRGEN